MDVDLLARIALAGVAVLAICEVIRIYIRHRWGLSSRGRHLFTGVRVALLTYVGCALAVLGLTLWAVHLLDNFRM